MPKPLQPIRVALADRLGFIRNLTWLKWFQWTDKRMKGDPGDLSINWYAGNPNGNVIGSPGDIVINTNGGAGTTLYVKESGVDTTAGWVGK